MLRDCVVAVQVACYKTPFYSDWWIGILNSAIVCVNDFSPGKWFLRIQKHQTPIWAVQISAINGYSTIFHTI